MSSYVLMTYEIRKSSYTGLESHIILRSSSIPFYNRWFYATRTKGAVRFLKYREEN